MSERFQIMDVIDGLHTKFDRIMDLKNAELHELHDSVIMKRKKMTPLLKIDDIPFNAKSTLAKIHAEQERKLKSSKAYKKKESANI